MSNYFDKKQQFNCPRDRDGGRVAVIKPGLYPISMLLQQRDDWQVWDNARELPPVLVSPVGEVAVKFPDKRWFRVMRQQWLSCCPVPLEKVREFRLAENMTPELREFLRELEDGYLYVWFPENQYLPNRTQPVRLHQMVAEKFVAINSYCMDYDDRGKMARRTDLEVDHLDGDRSNNHHSNLVWVPPWLNKLWIGWTVEQKLEKLAKLSDIGDSL